MDPTSQPEFQFPDLSLNKAIVAITGLPSTCKSEIARKIGRWAKCQVCYIDDFLATVSLAKGCTPESDQSPPSGEEAERLHRRLAFDSLCRAALRHLRLSDSGCVVLKSRLRSSFELDLLIRLANSFNSVDRGEGRIIVVIIECQMKNEYRWKSLLGLSHGQNAVWYKAGSWSDIEKVRDDDDCLDSQSWDLHLLSSLKADPIRSRRRVTRLVVDLFSDLTISSSSNITLPLDFLDAIAYLLIDRHEYLADLDGDDEIDHSIGNLALYRGAYKALQYDELRRDLLETELRASMRRNSRLCGRNTAKGGSCVFKYWLALPAGGSCKCRGCGLQVNPGQPAYTCHFCSLTLHKLCAEMLDFAFVNHIQTTPIRLGGGEFSNLFGIRRRGLRDSVFDECKSCKGANLDDHCELCVYKMHLRGGMLPTIINHDCHQIHFLSIQLVNEAHSCKACGRQIDDSGNYVCHICNLFYHMECVLLPGEVKHEHGGYEHLMKLLYSHEATDDREDDHWCNICYDDMDPQTWFYSCQECPYYVTHASSGCVGCNNVREAINRGHLPIREIKDKVKAYECRTRIYKLRLFYANNKYFLFVFIFFVINYVLDLNSVHKQISISLKKRIPVPLRSFLYYTGFIDWYD